MTQEDRRERFGGAAFRRTSRKIEYSLAENPRELPTRLRIRGHTEYTPVERNRRHADGPNRAVGNLMEALLLPHASRTMPHIAALKG